ncbi:hypothetical protein K438DRAFT_1993123 [Mycena galopus ATCC 62051]|nr:hypothetical protein K438DRAFT_1993123 [Mycena galopus ATCC 62051]
MPMPTPPCRPRLSPLGPPGAHATVPVAHTTVFIACHCHRRLPSTPWSPTRRPPLEAMRLLLVSFAWDPAPDCARRLDTAFVPFELIRNLPSLVSLLFAYVPPSPIHPTLFPRPSLAPHFCPFFPRFHDTNQHPTQAEAETAAAAAAKADEHAELAKAAYDTEIARMRRTLLHRETMRLRRREWDRQRCVIHFPCLHWSSSTFRVAFFLRIAVPRRHLLACSVFADFRLDETSVAATRKVESRLNKST